MSSQILQPNCATFPLVKFSYHTGPNGTRSHTWTHINYRNDLNLVFRDVRLIDDFANHETRSWMKVIGGTEILESQDLSQLVAICQEYNSSTGRDHPIEIVVKTPFMAMKYPKTANTVRRIQFKFHKNSDFILAVTMLQNIGLSILDKDAILKCPSSSSPTSLKTSIPVLSSRLSFPRPSSTGHASFQEGSFSQGILTASPANSRLNILMRPNSTASDLGKPIIEYSDHSPHPTRPISANASLPAHISAPSFSGTSSFKNQSLQSKTDYLSQIEVENYQVSQSIHSKTPGFADFGLSMDSNYIIQMDQSLENKNKNKPNEVSSLPNVLSFFRTQPEDKITAETQNTDFLTNNQLITDSTNPGLLSNIAEPVGDRDIWIPPKRTLPFSKSQTIPRTCSSPFKDLPPLPKPTPVAKDNPYEPGNLALKKSSDSISQEKKSIPKKRTQSKKTASGVLAKKQDGINSSVVAASQPTKENNKSSTTKKRIASRPASTLPRIQPKRAALTNKRIDPALSVASKNEQPRMVDQGTQTHLLQSPDDSNDQALVSTQNRNYIVLDSPFAETPPQTFLTLVDEFVTKYKAQPAPKELWEKPDYINADEEVRRSLVNNFICENLGNKDFLQLCEDVEFSWQKIGFGFST